jgi:serine/threonine protein kinase HipA of HipAB toxin-antitoxin module
VPLTAYFANLEQKDVFYKSEGSFLKFIVTPLYELANMFEKGGLQEIFNILQSNQKYYEDKLQDLTRKIIEENPKNDNTHADDE